jgi:hypothetical protein
MTYDRHELPLELQGQGAPGFVELDFSSVQDEVVAAETGVVPTGELSDEARAALPDVSTDHVGGYDDSKDHLDQRGGVNHRGYEQQTPAQHDAMRRGIALARELRNKQG